MRRFALISSVVLAALVLSATAALADPPTHTKFTISDTFTAPAGTACDFNYQVSFTIEFNVITFGDPNNPTRFIDHETQYVTHVNLDTGYTLTEVDHATFQDNGTGRFKTVGLVWHLRDPSGKIVVVHAGQLIIDLNTGEILKATPNVGTDAAAIICPALGGSPAT